MRMPLSSQPPRFGPNPSGAEEGAGAPPRPPMASLLQLHYPLSSPRSGLLQEYTLERKVRTSGSSVAEGQAASNLRYNEDLLIEDMDMFAGEMRAQ